MKKILAFIAFLSAILSVKAQDEGIRFGVSAGINQSALYGRDINNLSNGGKPEMGYGWTVGLSLHNTIRPHFALKHELFVTHKQVQLQIEETLKPVFKSKLERTYIELYPISATYHRKRFQVYAGPYLGMLVSASIQRKDEEGKRYTDKSFYGNAEMEGNYSQKFDAGIVSGIGYELPMGFMIDARYLLGFVPIVENTENVAQWKVYSQGITLTLGFTFR